MEKLLGSASRWMTRLAGVVAALALAACGGGGGGGGDDAGSGTLRVAITDAPSCYEEVWVTVDKVRVHQSSSAAESDGGWRELDLAAPRRINLLALTNGVLEELGSTPLPAGTYSQLRLVLAENSAQRPLANSVKPIGGQEVALKTPSGQQSGLKLQVHFTVEPNRLIDLVIDFDACKSVVKAGRSGNYILKPVISVTPRFVTAIQGYVTTTMTLSATSVSAQQDGAVVRATVPNPRTGEFVLAFLPEGTYNVVVTSDNRATGVITSVPVSTTNATTRVNGTATAIVLPTSAMQTVEGRVTATETTGSNTTTVVVKDATVTALQSVGSATVEVDSMAVDFDLGTYTMSLPTAAPRRAPYSTTGVTRGLNFTADADSAGKYTLKATAPGRATQTRSANLSSGPATVNFSY